MTNITATITFKDRGSFERFCRMVKDFPGVSRKAREDLYPDPESLVLTHSFTFNVELLQSFLRVVSGYVDGGIAKMSYPDPDGKKLAPVEAEL